MKLELVTFKRMFLGMSLFYYMGFLNFVTSFLGSRGDDVFAANASGSLSNQILGIILLAMCLILIFQARIVSLNSFARQFFLWGLLIFWVFLSVSWSYAPAVTFRRGIAFTILVLTAFCLVQIFTPKSLLRAFVIAVLLAAVIGLIEAVISPSSAFVSSGIRAGAFTGMYFDKNGGARVYAYALLLLFGLGFYKQKWGMYGFLILSLCLLMTRSATATVLVVAGITMLFVFKAFKGKNATINFLRFGLLAILSIICVYALMLAYEFILSLLGRDPGLTNRTIIWELLDKYIMEEFFFGYGFGAFWASDAVSGFMERWGFIGNAHSGYYEVMLNIGAIGFIILAGIMLFSFFRLIQSFIFDRDISLSTTLFVILILQAVVNYIGFIILNHNSVDMFLYLICFFISMKQHTNKNQSSIKSYIRKSVYE
ncbi:O-antigen ligase family protein [Glaciecola sp. 1036]|uniref:O-antigen ligase family protein n=1 Tax=Alteromonadaceae TaxID=72275 RepID=UPI003D060BAC